jgi:hypothetical protein
MPSIALPTPRNDPAAVSSRRKRLALGALLTVVVVGLLLSATFRHDLIAFARRLGVSGAGWLLFAATSALTLFIAALSLLPLLLAFWCVRIGSAEGVRYRAARMPSSVADTARAGGSSWRSSSSTACAARQRLAATATGSLRGNSWQMPRPMRGAACRASAGTAARAVCASRQAASGRSASLWCFGNVTIWETCAARGCRRWAIKQG